MSRLEREAEALIVSALRREAPDADFICEEQGETRTGAALAFYVDPLDGTKSFLRRNHFSAASIAAERDGRLVASCVYDFMRDIAYVGYEGMGRVLHGTREHPLPLTAPPDHQPQMSLDPEGLRRVDARKPRPKVRAVYNAGSIALCLAHVASGAFDGMVSLNRGAGAPWDVAAGVHLLGLAGCLVLDMDGRPYNFKCPKNGIIAMRPGFEAWAEIFIGGKSGAGGAS